LTHLDPFDRGVVPRFGPCKARNDRDCFLAIVSGGKRGILKSTSPARSRWIALGRIGFMSTQRRQDHLRLADCKDRAVRWGIGFLCLLARELFAIASGQTAPPEIQAPEFPVSTATNSLSSDDHNQQPVRLVFTNIRIGSPPSGRLSRLRPPRGHFAGYPPIHSSADRASHSTLPRVPAAIGCRTERYDGKGNLYFKHAA
jgi:hypothetical protein